MEWINLYNAVLFCNFIGACLIPIILSAIYSNNTLRNNGQALGYDEFYQVSAAKHLATAFKVT